MLDEKLSSSKTGLQLVKSKEKVGLTSNRVRARSACSRVPCAPRTRTSVK